MWILSKILKDVFRKKRMYSKHKTICFCNNYDTSHETPYMSSMQDVSNIHSLLRFPLHGLCIWYLHSSVIDGTIMLPEHMWARTEKFMALKEPRLRVLLCFFIFIFIFHRPRMYYFRFDMFLMRWESISENT